MADPIEILPGDTVTAECPAGAAPSLAPGATLQAGVPDKEVLFHVVRVDGRRIVLGPRKMGYLQAEVPCGPGAFVSLPVRVVETKKEDLPPREVPLAPETVAYPLWLWLALAMALLLVAAGLWGWWWRRRLRSRRAPSKRRAAPVRTPEERFEAYLSSALKERWVDRDEPEFVRRLYAQGYERLREFLESKLGFQAPEATTREFVGELKAAVLHHNNAVGAGGSKLMDESSGGGRSRKRAEASLPGTVEALMTQADQVRFAAERPPVEDRKAFLKSVQQVRQSL